MANPHDDTIDYEFASPWETHTTSRQARQAPQPPTTTRQAIRQELREQLITIAPEPSTLSQPERGIAEWPRQTPRSRRTPQTAAPDGPQTFNRGCGTTSADQVQLNYGNFAVPPIELFDHHWPPLSAPIAGSAYPRNGSSEDPISSSSSVGTVTGYDRGPQSAGFHFADHDDNSDVPSIIDESEYTGLEGPTGFNFADPESESPDGPIFQPSGFNFSNLADVRERQGSSPDGSFSLDPRRHYDFDRRFFGPRNNNLNHIGIRTGTHLAMPTSASDPVIHMWGSPEQIKAAKKLLQELVHLINEEIDRAEPRVGGWAKIRATVSARRQAHLEEQALKAKIRQIFRRPPPEGMQFPAVGVFLWPSQEFDPLFTLGKNLEHLDSIRFEYQVYIIWNRKRSLFRVLGENSDNVDKAIDRIYGCFCETAAKNRRPNRTILVEPPSAQMKGVRVRLNSDHDLRDRQLTYSETHAPGIQLSLVGPAPSKTFLRKWYEDSIVKAYANDAYMRRVMQQGLYDVAYFRGYVKLKFYIGRLFLFGYLRSDTGHYDLQEYIENVRSRPFEGELIRYLGNSDLGVTDEEVAIAAISRMSCAPDTFTPVDLNEDLHVRDVTDQIIEPQIGATFDLKMFDGTGKNVRIRLEVVFLRASGSDKYTVGEHRWLIPPSSDMRDSESNYMRRSPVDVIVQDLESEVGYQMELSTWEVLPFTDIYPIFDQFLHNCSVEVIRDEHGGDDAPVGAETESRMIKRVVYANLPGLSVDQVTQKTKYRFWQNGCTYRYELTKYEHLPTDEILELYRDSVVISWKGIISPPDVRWGAAMENASWDNDLRQQLTVEKGKRGTWNTDVGSFFPPTESKPISGGTPDWKEDDGFEECIVRAKDFMLFLKKIQMDVAREKALLSARGSTVDTDDASSSYGGPEEYDM
ncbi:hypothetical protein EX30DRAFT_324243 [Ascodesmis nigricans]|uniref:DUF7905 domain-containing protein n=1 Tax=Ascodesmis nigricans TaxID=341454 RepID=A0A4S2MIY6_9PEZI|nr:hypothetical protein EX30DRAFT_324243 [Ascodesmis nigricans]